MKKNVILAVTMLCFIFVLSSCGKQGLLIETDIIPVKIGEKYGYVDHNGKYVIQPQFDYAAFFSDGLAAVKTGGKYGYINKKGEFKINPIYKDASIFNEGIAWVVKDNGAPIAINKNGETLFELKEAEVVTCFSEGIAKFGIINPNGESSSDYLYGYVNEKGKVIIPPSYVIAESFSKGLALVKKNYGEKYGFINKEGNYEINPQFDKAKSFNNMDQAIVSIDESTGVIDKKGIYVINPQFDYMINDEGRYIIATDKASKFGWCDDKGKIIINPQFEQAMPFNSNDIAPVAMGEKMGYIDKSGKIVINPQFEQALPFIGDIAIVATGNDGKTGFINKKGEYTANPQFSDIGLGFSLIYENNIDATSLSDVYSDYFNIEIITNKLKSITSNNTIDSIGFNTPISDIMSRYNLSKSDFDYYYSYCTLKNTNISPDAKLKLIISGDFANTVSDGWWGYNRVLNNSAKPNIIYINITLENKGKGKADTLYSNILKNFNIKNNGRNLQVGKIGNLHASFELYPDSDLIAITAVPNENALPMMEETYTDEETEMETYIGKINYKYDIEMTLGFEAGVVFGSYYYISNSNKTPISLNGEYGTEDISMVESTNGKATGTFTGKKIGNEISGTWINADGTKTFPFSVNLKE